MAEKTVTVQANMAINGLQRGEVGEMPEAMAQKLAERGSVAIVVDDAPPIVPKDNADKTAAGNQAPPEPPAKTD